MFFVVVSDLRISYKLNNQNKVGGRMSHMHTHFKLHRGEVLAMRICNKLQYPPVKPLDRWGRVR